jgi:hypothetical protein
MKQSPTSSPSGMQPTGCGELSPAERPQFEEHLASCLTCQSAVSKLTAHLGSAGSGLASGCGDAVCWGELASRWYPDEIHTYVVAGGRKSKLLKGGHSFRGFACGRCGELCGEQRWWIDAASAPAGFSVSQQAPPARTRRT